MKTAVKTRTEDARDQMMSDYAAGRRGGFTPQRGTSGESHVLCL